MIDHRRFATTAALLPLSIPQWVQAQEFPTRPIRFLNPFQAGSNGDVAPRLVLTRAAETIGQPFIIDSHQGGSHRATPYDGAEPRNLRWSGGRESAPV